MRTYASKALVVVALLWVGVSSGAGVNLPEFPRGKGDNCVETTDIMRKNHMEFLTHQRDLTVHDGIRSSKHSLVECIQCHVQKDAQGQFIPVNAPGQFCQSCHQFTATRLDCFECHATVPEVADRAEQTDNITGQRPVHDWPMEDQERQLYCANTMQFENSLSIQKLQQEYLQIFDSGEGQ